jgi:hypothetical protein
MTIATRPYVFGPTVAKYRVMGPIAEMAESDRRAYGHAVLTEVRAKQRRAMIAAPSQERRARKSKDWEAMYAEAMREKRERAALPAAPIVKPMERKKKLSANAEASSARPKPAVMPKPAVTAGYAIVPMKQKDRFVVTVPRMPDGSKATPEIIIGNQIKCRYSHRDAGYIATAAQVERFERILGMVA